MTYSQKYCLVQPLEPLAIGDEFTYTDWPLHCTVLGVFALDWTEVLFEEFTALCRSHESFTVPTGDVAYFGPTGEVKVRLLENSLPFRQLHGQTADFITNHGGAFNSPEYQHAGFRPHITMRAQTPAKHVSVLFTQLALIDMFPDADYTRRKIIRLFPLAAR